MFEVKWTGRYPNLCSGEWIIYKDGKRVEIPKELRNSPMYTYGTYSTWHFEDRSEVFEDYNDGLGFNDWIKFHTWVKEIAPTVPEQEELYLKISDQDWRHNSCGGCI